MQYLFLAVLILATVSVFIWAGVKTAGLKKFFLQKILTKKIVGCGIFSTLAVNETARYILRQPSSKRRLLLKNINENDFAALISNIDSADLSAKLRLMVFNEIVAVKTPNVLYELMRADFYLKQQDYEAALPVFQKIKKYKKTRAEQGYQALLAAKAALFEADLQAASEEASKALKIFQKHNLLFEEAGAYYVLGTIYRVSGVFDAADFMLRSALKLYRFIGATVLEAEVLGTFGLLMAAQKRFDEASSYFEQAGKVFLSAGDTLNQKFVICQQAMLELLQNNLKQAEKILKKVPEDKKTPALSALVSDIAGRINFAAGRWNKTAEYAVKAAEQYLKQKNFAAAFECFYMQAEALVNQNDLDEAELVLRDLIHKERYHKSCFHIANVHTLLGLIFLQKNDVKRAKTIFNQALAQELHNDRAAGIAVDYANLAVVEKKCGNTEEARKNLELALSYAKEADDELYNKIRAALD